MEQPSVTTGAPGPERGCPPSSPAKSVTPTASASKAANPSVTEQDESSVCSAAEVPQTTIPTEDVPSDDQLVEDPSQASVPATPPSHSGSQLQTASTQLVTETNTALAPGSSIQEETPEDPSPTRHSLSSASRPVTPEPATVEFRGAPPRVLTTPPAKSQTTKRRQSKKAHQPKRGVRNAQ